MTTFADIVTALSNQSFTLDQLKTINRLVNVNHRANQAHRSEIAKASLSVGDVVSFKSTKLFREVSGKILKIKPKNILIDCGSDGKWNVPATMVKSA